MLPDQEVAALSQKIFAKRNEYKPKKSTRKYIVNRDIISDPREAQSIVANMINQKKRENTLEFLKSIYQEGMTQKQLSQEAEMGIATIKRYWKQLVTNNN
jgi:hypothetical protein